MRNVFLFWGFGEGLKVKASWLTNNLGLKVIALILAVIVWFYAAAEGTDQVTLRVPLQVQPPSENMRVIKGSNQFLRVVFQAPRNLINILSSQQVVASHKIEPKVKAGEYSFRVSSEDFQLPAGSIRVQEIFPQVVTVTLDEVSIREVKVKPDVQGEPATGFSLNASDILADPSAVLVQGPKTKLEKIDSIQTEPIDVVGRIRSFRRRVKLNFGPDFKPISTDTVDVYVPLVEQFSSKKFENVPVKVLDVPEKTFSIYLDPTKVTILLKGPLRLLEGLKDEDLMAYVELTGLKSGKYDLPLKLTVPAGISLKGDPPKIHVIIEEVKR